MAASTWIILFVEILKKIITTFFKDFFFVQMTIKKSFEIYFQETNIPLSICSIWINEASKEAKDKFLAEFD